MSINDWWPWQTETIFGNEIIGPNLQQRAKWALLLSILFFILASNTLKYINFYSLWSITDVFQMVFFRLLAEISFWSEDIGIDFCVGLGLCCVFLQQTFISSARLPRLVNNLSTLYGKFLSMQVSSWGFLC